MVKRLDDASALMIEHVGLDLWQAATAWRNRLHGEMVARGHAWYGDARAAIAASLDPRGLPQAELAVRMKVSKQAVQQLLDGLEADDVVRRVPDPNDGRGKRVVYTAKGLSALRDAVAIKREMEADLRKRLGPRAFEQLRASLQEVVRLWG